MGCKCPRCGRGKLYSSYLKVADHCRICELDYSTADAGDGPAVFLIFIVGFLAVILLMILNFGFNAPAWLTLLITLGFSTWLIWVSLPPLKAYMIALQYANKAREGKLDDDSGDEEDRL